MDPKGKAPAPTPPYRQDAQNGYLPSVPFPHAGPEPSGQALRSFLKGNSLDTSAHSLGMSRELATGLAFSLGKIAFSTITLGRIGLTISIFQIFWRASLAGLALVSLASRSLLAFTAFTFSAGRRLAIFIHLLDRGFGRILAGFLCHSFCLGLIPPMILSGMRLGTVGVTEGQTNGTVF